MPELTILNLNLIVLNLLLLIFYNLNVGQDSFHNSWGTFAAKENSLSLEV